MILPSALTPCTVVFGLYDLDKDGFVGESELIHTMKQMKQNLTDQQLEQVQSPLHLPSSFPVPNPTFSFIPELPLTGLPSIGCCSSSRLPEARSRSTTVTATESFPSTSSGRWLVRP